MSLRRILSITAATLVVAACTSTTVPTYAPPIDYATLAPYRLNVAEAITVNDSPSVPATEEMAKRYGRSPEDALSDWTTKRVQATGTQGTFSVIIKDANLTSKTLPVKGGISGYFTHEQSKEWAAFLNVLMSVDGGSLPPAEVTIKVSSSHTIPEDASEQQKKQIYDAMLNDMIAKFEVESNKYVQTYFKAYMM